MAGTRYREKRTLVRPILRLPREGKANFKDKVRRLREHFEKFNVDVSELCQWLMGLRPEKTDESSRPFWDFILEPKITFENLDEKELDRIRRRIFEVAVGFEEESSLKSIEIPDQLLASIRFVSGLKLTNTAQKLFERLGKLHKTHRQVLIKAAADWIVARYQRGYENWVRQREEWEKEKKEWEEKNPELTEDVREEFLEIYKELGIREKRPRICSWEKLRENRENCEYAGEGIRSGGKIVRHSPLCVNYMKFLDDKRKAPHKGKKGKFNKRFFVENAKKYLELRRKMSGPLAAKAMEIFLQKEPKARWFPDAWKEYLKALGIKEETILKTGGDLPHCLEFGGSDCEFNIHTDLCKKYREELLKRPHLQEFDNLYRDWRKSYLSGPRKPSFKYPSSRILPMPKIFGEKFFEVDFTNSVLELRLDNMPEGSFDRFGFKPWPKDYKPQPVKDETEITSVHVNFIGTRPRVGFHFQVPHKESRFSMSQDEIDILRSQKYPRRAQDIDFLKEARNCLIESFDGDPEKEMKILSVDIGTSAGAIALFEGKKFIEAEPLKVLKLDKLFDSFPEPDDDKKPKSEIKKEKKKGLSKDHVTRHVADWSEKISEITKKRNPEDKKESKVKIIIGQHDMRGLTLHIKRMKSDWVRLNTSQIIKSAEKFEVDLIVFESLRDFKLPGYEKISDEAKKSRLAFLTPGRIRHKTREKAVERGMRVVTVPDFKSSRVCSECGKEQQDRKRWLKNKHNQKFECENEDCGYDADSDENAARVLGKVFWGEIELPEPDTS